MVINLELPAEAEAALEAQAKAKGLTVAQFIAELAASAIPPATKYHLQVTDPNEWYRQFHEWAESHDRTTPLLSDEAVSRESIYSDRI